MPGIRQFKNIEVKNKASLNLTEYDESIFVEIKGNSHRKSDVRQYRRRLYCIKKDNQVIIDKDVTGTTKAAVGNKLFPSVFTEGYTYITAQGKAAKESFAPAKAGWFLNIPWIHSRTGQQRQSSRRKKTYLLADW